MNHGKLEEFHDWRLVTVQGHIKGTKYDSNCNFFISFNCIFKIISANKLE